MTSKPIGAQGRERKVGALNVRGIAGKCEEILEVMEEEGVDLVFLSETRGGTYSQAPMANVVFWDPYPHRTSSAVGAQPYGIAILLSSKEMKNRGELRILGGGTPGLTALFMWKGVEFGGVYLPPNLPLDDCKTVLEPLCEGRNVRPRILLGDFNMRLGEMAGDRTHDTRGNQLFPWITEAGVGHFLCPQRGREATFRTGPNCWSVPDHVIASEPARALEPRMEVVGRSDTGGSDHRMIYVAVRAGHGEANGGSPRTGVEYKRFRVKRLEIMDVQREYSNVLDELLQPLDAKLDALMMLQDREATQLEVDECETAIGDAIRNAARLVLGVQNVRKHKSKLNIQALQEVKKQRRKAFEDFKKAHSDDDRELLWIRYRNLHAAEKKCLKSETKLAFDQFSQEFSEKGSTEQSKILRRIMTVKKGMSANCLSTVGSDMEKYRLYFQDMFRKEAQADESPGHYNDGVNRGDGAMQGVRNTFATNEEIWNCVCQCQAGKSTGVSRFGVELVKGGGSLLIGRVGKLFQICWWSGKCPAGWNKALLCPVFKKGDKSRIQNYRPIMLSDFLRKTFERCLMSKWMVNESEGLNTCQGGFRKGRSTIDQVTSLHEAICQRKRDMKKSPTIAFLDIKAAYDSVDREILWERMRVLGSRGAVMDILRSLFDHNTSRVVIGGEESKEIVHGRGLLQGSVLSPLLYSIYIDGLAVKLRREGRGRLATVPISAFFYADDIALVADDRLHLSKMLKVCEEHSIAHKYRFAPEKCVILSEDMHGPPVLLYGLEVEQRETFTYLGIQMGVTGMKEMETVKKAASKFVSSTNLMRSVGFNGGGFGLEARAHIFKTFLRPILEYGLCLVRKEAAKVLQKAANHGLRSLLGTAKSTSVNAMQALSGMEEVETRRLVLQAKWMDRVKRAPPSTMVCNAYRQHCWNPAGFSLFTRAKANPIVTGETTEMLLKDRRRKQLWETDGKIGRVLGQDANVKGVMRTLDRLGKEGRQTCIRWMMRRPWGEPLPCQNCDGAHRTSPKHVEECLGTDVDALFLGGEYHKAFGAVKRAWRVCHRGIFPRLDPVLVEPP